MDGKRTPLDGRQLRRYIASMREVVDNNQLCMFFDKMDFRTRDTEFDVIYVNGDNTLPNLRRDEEHWKVVLTEEEFQKRMFEEE